MIKLIATDMDGTFLDKAGTYDKERLRRLLADCQQKGIYFVVASGRCLLSIKKLFAEFTDQIIFLAENGGVVEYQENYLYEQTMSRDVYLKIVDAVLKSPFQNAEMVHLSGKHASYVFSDISPDYEAFLEHYSPRLVRVDEFSKVTDAVYKVGASFTAEEVYPASQWITQNISGVHAMTSGYDCLDVMLEEVNKGHALSELCKTLGITMDQVVAFGDNLNDQQMLEVAGQVIVPENARPEIKALANRIIPSHETGTVIACMEELVCQSN